MELRAINVEDIYPDEKNPRRDFGDIVALAESCMLNALNPGEPVNPIVVVADGGIYRIVDGERRYKAMRHNKLTSCNAVVCDDMDEAGSMIAMITTDDKERLTEIERSRGVQQMLLLGVDPAKVERVGRMAKGSAAKLSRARAAVDDAGDDMTLDRMLAIAEFDAVGDDDAVSKLTSCREAEWSGLVSTIRADRKHEAACDALRSACANAGITLADEGPSHHDHTYCACEGNPDDIANSWAELPAGSVAWLCEYSYAYPEVRFYKPVGAEDEIDPEAQAMTERIHEIEQMILFGSKKRRRWFSYTVNEQDASPTVRRFLNQSFFAHSDNEYQKLPGDIVVEFANETSLSGHGGIKYETSGAFAIYLYETKNNEMTKRFARVIVDGNPNEWDRGNMLEWIDWMDLFTRDGYERNEVENGLLAMVVKALEVKENNEEE